MILINKIFRLIYDNKKNVFLDKSSFLHNWGSFYTKDLSDVELKGIKVGRRSYIGRYFNLHTSSQIIIGEDCVVSDYVYISTVSHGIDPQKGPIIKQEWIDEGEIIIGDNCFIGFSARILPNVKLGEWCIIAANAVVTKSFPSYTMLAGCPARVIKKYNLESERWEAINEDI
ncbi:acyltransferase [Photobacterium kagoshimensis]|uniref:acyltransferase n=1 Tax=Photobacterium kagoshimensis TaxID=2910242 RepID=UPI003D136FE2